MLGGDDVITVTSRVSYRHLCMHIDHRGPLAPVADCRQSDRYRACLVRLHTASVHRLPTANGRKMQTWFRRRRDVEPSAGRQPTQPSISGHQRCTTDQYNVTTFQIPTSAVMPVSETIVALLLTVRCRCFV